MADKSKLKKLNAIEWLGFRSDTNFEDHQALGRAFGFVLMLVGLVLAGLAIATVILMVAVIARSFGTLPTGDLGNTLRGIAFSLGAIVGLPFLVWRSWVAHRQADISHQGLLTDRFTKAVEQLGAEKVTRRQRKAKNGTLLFENKLDENGIQTGDYDPKKPIFEEVTEPNIEVRLGALYALERISQDSERDHIPIMETICAYVRENAAEPRYKEESAEYPLAKYHPPRVDIQAAMTILGRRSAERRAYERQETDVKRPYSLDLRNSQLARVDLNEAELDYALFDGAVLNGAQLDGAVMNGAQLDGASLNEAQLDGARLDGASLVGASLVGALLVGALLNGARLNKARLDGASLDGARLIEARLDETLLDGARLNHARLNQAVLYGAWLYRASLYGAELNEAILTSAVLKDSDFAQTSCKDVFAKSVDFTETVNLTQIQIDQMFGDNSVVLPETLQKPDHWPDGDIEIGKLRDLHWQWRNNS